MRNLGFIIGLLSLSATSFGCASQAIVQNHTELPVSRVVMYQSGIGYVERNATVDSNELVLRIRPDQINDILKSLTVIDRANGRPVSISLPVDRQTLDRLSEIPEQVRDGGIKDLIQAFRGAHVKIKTRNSSYNGRIVGINEPESTDATSAEDINTQTLVTLLSDGNKLDVISLADIKSVELYDKSLSNGLDKSLNISLNEGNWKQIELNIRMDSNKKRELALSYLVAMPTWKPAYRLIIEDNTTGTLQGWAIISNVTGADWNNISFSLVSGQPMSFTYDLYTPQFLTRPDLSGLANKRAAAPKITDSGYAGGTAARKSEPVMPPYRKDRDFAVPKIGGGTIMNAVKQSQPAAKKSIYNDVGADELYDIEAEEAYEDAADEFYEAPAAIESSEMIAGFTELASKAQIGSFDEYKLASTLSVPDGNTALVNLIQKQLHAQDSRLIERPSFWSFNDFYKGWRETHSYQTIELKNDTDVALDAGPITIYRDSAVIGEGYLARTERDATAYITFANEGRLSVSVIDTTSNTSYHLDKVNNGRCTIQEETNITHTFEFNNNLQSSTTALFQLPRFSDWTPVNFPENITKTDSAYIIPTVIDPGAKQVMPLTMKMTHTSSTKLNASAACIEAINEAIQNGNITGDMQNSFKEYIEIANKAAELNDKIAQLSMRRNEIQSDQNSLSRNLEGLKDIKTPNANSLKNQLMERQKSNEKELANITTELYSLQVENSELTLKRQTLERTLKYNRK